MDKFNLKGKIALITGAAGMLGREHTLALLEAGARVVITDLDIKKLHLLAVDIEQLGHSDDYQLIQMNVTNVKSILDASEEIVKVWGHVDILINNAAVDPKVTKENGLIEKSRFENFLLEQWNFQISVGLTGAYLCCQIFGSAMAARKSGVIVNIASDLSVFAPDQRIYQRNGLSDDMQPVKPVTYSVIKTGLVGLTKYLATYWAEKNVRVNAISPGGVYVDQPSEFVSKIENLIPLARMANKDEYRGAIQFLCSDASSYMTGQNLIIDGGRSVW